MREGLDLVGRLSALAAEFGGNREMSAALRAALADGQVTDAEMAALVSLAARLRMARAPSPSCQSGMSEEDERSLDEVCELAEEWSESAEMVDEARDVLSDGRVSRDELSAVRRLASKLAEESRLRAEGRPRWVPPVPRPTWAVPKREEEGDD